jgi:RNA polymerase sigma factor for flagellar operon FliA
MPVLLNKTEVEELWTDYKNDPSIDNRNKIVLSYAGLVKSIARRAASVSGNFVDIEDLLSFGMLGLIKAVEKFDPDKGVIFETYASYRIRGEIIDYMRRNDWVPRGVRKKAQDIENAAEEFKKQNKREPTNYELAEILGVKPDEINHIISDIDRFNTVSFEEIIQDTIKTDCNFVSDETPEVSLAQSELNDTLANAIENLPEREKLVITLYYYEELTLKEIGHIMNISESRVSQLHTRAVRILKKAMADY